MDYIKAGDAAVDIQKWAADVVDYGNKNPFAKQLAQRGGAFIGGKLNKAPSGATKPTKMFAVGPTATDASSLVKYLPWIIGGVAVLFLIKKFK